MKRLIVFLDDTLERSMLHSLPAGLSVSAITMGIAALYQPELWQIILSVLAALVSLLTIVATVLRMIREHKRALREIEKHEREMGR